MSEHAIPLSTIQVRDVQGVAEFAEEQTLESALFLVQSEKIHHLSSKIVSTLDGLHERQKEVRRLQEIIALLNKNVTDEGTLTVEEGSLEQELLEELQSRGVQVKQTVGVFNPQQYDRLIENIKMSVEGLNVQNEMNLQDVTRLQNEQYNVYQLVKSIHKPLDEDKRNKARAVGGR
jgi:hypothetical protein